MSTYLVHYGIKGMKWGVRRYHNKDGSLTKEGYDRYYTNGRLNARGNRYKARAALSRNNARWKPNAFGVGATALSAYINHKWLYKPTRELIHQMGNTKITAMKMMGAPYKKRKAVATAYVAAYGALQVAEILPYATTAYNMGRYRLDSTYRNRLNTAANLSIYRNKEESKHG